MAEIRIWGKLGGRKPEVIDRTNTWSDAHYLIREYRLAYGKQWVIWAGTRADEPKLQL